MKDLLKEIQKLVPPSGTPRWMLYPGPLGSPTCTLYEVIGEVELVPASQAGAGPSQPARTSKPPESERILDREKTLVPEWIRWSQVRRKSTEQLARSGRGQSPNPDRGRTSERSRTPERARTPEMMRTLDRTKTLDRGKGINVAGLASSFSGLYDSGAVGASTLTRNVS